MSDVNPLNPLNPSPLGGPAQSSRPAASGATSAPDFADLLRDQLEKVSRIQAEADQGVQNFLTGREQNLTEVFSSARKAQVAFSLLMEIRNKLTDAYNELKQLRV